MPAYVFTHSAVKQRMRALAELPVDATEVVTRSARS